MEIITKLVGVEFLKMMKTQGCFTLDHAIEKIEKRFVDYDDVVFRMWPKGEKVDEIRKINR